MPNAVDTILGLSQRYMASQYHIIKPKHGGHEKTTISVTEKFASLCIMDFVLRTSVHKNSP